MSEANTKTPLMEGVPCEREFCSEPTANRRVVYCEVGNEGQKGCKPRFQLITTRYRGCIGRWG